MPIALAIIGGLIMGAVGNVATGIISFVLLFFLFGSFEEHEAHIAALRQRLSELEAENERLHINHES